MNARHSKESPRWGTSVDYIEMSRVALGGRIELDPMSEPCFNALVKADRYFTEQDDCFMQSWQCETMLLNPAGGLIAKAWQRLVFGYLSGEVKRAVWVGFSVEQLNLLADEPQHPDDFSKLTCRQRIDFLTPHPIRRVASITGDLLNLECGHTQPAAAKSRKSSGRSRIQIGVRCKECDGDPEPNGAPSHSNYVVGLGIAPALFERAFAGRGRFSHGALRVRARLAEAA